MEQDPRIDHFHAHMDNLREAGIEFPATGMVRMGEKMLPVVNVSHEAVSSREAEGGVRRAPGGVSSYFEIPDERAKQPHGVAVHSINKDEGDGLLMAGFYPGIEYDKSREGRTHEDAVAEGEDTATTHWFNDIKPDSGTESMDDFVQTVPDRISNFHAGAGAIPPQHPPEGPEAHELRLREHVVGDHPDQDYYSLGDPEKLKYTPETGEVE